MMTPLLVADIYCTLLDRRLKIAVQPER